MDSSGKSACVGNKCSNLSVNKPRCAQVHLRSFDTRLCSKKETREREKKKTGTTLTHAPASASCSEIRKLSDLLGAAHADALQRYVFLSLFILRFWTFFHAQLAVSWQTWRFLCSASDASPDSNASPFRRSCNLPDFLVLQCPLSLPICSPLGKTRNLRGYLQHPPDLCRLPLLRPNPSPARPLPAWLHSRRKRLRRWGFSSRGSRIQGI